jgi:hypothetical protein
LSRVLVEIIKIKNPEAGSLVKRKRIASYFPPRGLKSRCEEVFTSQRIDMSISGEVLFGLSVSSVGGW